MYNLIKFLVVVIALLGILYLFNLNKKGNTLKSQVNKDKIIKYFEEKRATSIESGITTKELPEDIRRDECLFMLLKEKTIVFKKGKYFLNKNSKNFNFF